MKTLHTILPAVFLILIKDNKVLLSRRFNTGHRDGEYSVPAGHVEKDETPRAALVREAKEEIGIEISEDTIEFAHICHRSPKTDRYYIDHYFIARNWVGTPSNAEPEKCDDLQWFNIEKLPENTVPYVEKSIEKILQHIYYSELMWNNEKKMYF